VIPRDTQLGIVKERTNYFYEEINHDTLESLILTPFSLTSEDKHTHGRLIQENAKTQTTNNSMNILAAFFGE
jgi:pyruvoyl-dependent arginine decarboxylase (PvlArgDC)